MRAVIIGAGEIGYHIAKVLTSDRADVVLVDQSREALQRVEDHLDLMTIHGSGASPLILEQARIGSADLCIAVTHNDEINMLASLIASKSGVPMKVARVSSPDYFTVDTKLNPSDVGIDLLINPEQLSAAEFFRLLNTQAARELVEFAQGRVQLIGFKVGSENAIRDKSVQELRQNVLRSDVLFAAIKRADGSTIIPKGNDVIHVGDEVFAVGSGDAITHLLSCCGVTQGTLHRVVIGGAGKVGLLLAQMVEEAGARVTFIERDMDVAERVAGEFRKATVIHGDVHEDEVLEDAAVDTADGFVAVTGDDDSDVMACVAAKQKGAPRVLSLIQKPRYLPVLASIPTLDGVVSRHLTAVGAVLRLIRRGDIVSVASLHDIDAEAMELVARDHSKIVGKPLASLKFPGDALIGAIVRGNTLIVPSGADVVQPNDRVVVFCLPHAIHPVEKFFAR